MRTGARQIPFADGYGVSQRVAGSANTPLTLTPPATLDVQIADGGSAVVRVYEVHTGREVHAAKLAVDDSNATIVFDVAPSTLHTAVLLATNRCACRLTPPLPAMPTRLRRRHRPVF